MAAGNQHTGDQQANRLQGQCILIPMSRYSQHRYSMRQRVGMPYTAPHRQANRHQASCNPLLTRGGIPSERSNLLDLESARNLHSHYQPQANRRQDYRRT